MWQVIGQSKAVELLRRSLESGRLSHAYLLVGQPHVGKMTLAINLAQALNCESESEERPCGQCKPCLSIAAGNHPDVQVITRLSSVESGEAGVKKEIAIAQVREMERIAALQPFQGKHRVFIIDGAEYLNEESSNCLLKTLEEPPPNVLFILLAVNENRLLPTIVSRCQRIELQPIPVTLIEQALVERWRIPLDRARILSRLCCGSIGWAISAAQDEKLVEERSQRLGEFISMAEESLEQRFSFATKLAARFSKNRDEVREALKLWLEWWRDVILVREGCFQLITNIDQEETLRQHAGRYSLAEVRSFIQAIRAASEQLEQNVNPRLALEVLMLSIPDRGEEKDGVPQGSCLLR